MSNASPQLIANRYRLVEPLGQGGMGRVWKARDEVLQRDVAIKELVPPPGLTDDERREMRERSLREARAIARLNNPHVIRVFDVLRTDSDPWIVMEYVPSRSLQDSLAADGPVTPIRAAEIGLGVLSALRAAHRSGVMHRDVKPGNVLIGHDGRVVLTDFGLATVPGDPNVTRTGLVLGSPAYIAPERARDGTAGPEGDLWSLGATLYAAVEGQSPYARPSAIATLAALATEPPPPAKRAGPLKAVLNGLLQKDPTQRIDAETSERMLRRVAKGRRTGGMSLLEGVRRPSPLGQREDRDRTKLVPLPAPRQPQRLPRPTTASETTKLPTPAAPETTKLPTQPAAAETTKIASPGVDATAKVDTPAVDDAKTAAASTAAAGAAAVDRTEKVADRTEKVEESKAAESAGKPDGEQSGAASEATTTAEQMETGSPDGADTVAPVAEPAAATSTSETVKVDLPAATAAAETTKIDRPASVAETTKLDRPARPDVTRIEQRPPADRMPPVTRPLGTPAGILPESGRAGTPSPLGQDPFVRDNGGRSVTFAANPKVWLVAGLVLLLLITVAVIVPMLSSSDDETPPVHNSAETVQPTSAGSPVATPTAAATSAAPTTPPPTTPPASPSAATTGVPAGWYMYKDSSGYSVPVPNGWTIEHRGTIDYFRDPKSERWFLVDQTDSPKGNAVDDWKAQEANRKGNYANYQRVRIEAVEYFDYAADWEWTYTKNGTKLRTVNRGFVTAKDKGYAIRWETKASAWQDNLANFQIITTGFKPVRD